MEGHCFDALTGVTSLAHLRLDEAAVLPDSLHQLTWLRSLHISALERMEGGLMVGLEQALPALQRLTALALMGVPPWRPGLMGALGGLPRLQRLAVCHEWEGYGGRSGRGTLPPADLAAPACLSRLTTLGMDGDLLLRNPHLLEAAAQLQHLWLMGRGMRRAGYGRPWRRFKAWAQQHTPLRSLSLSPSYNSLGYVPSDIAAYQWRDLLALQRQRPGLVLHDWDSDASEDVLWQPFFAEAA